MQQRQYRPGDVLDDYCPRERRVMDHAIVAMVESEIQRTRCVVCDADHEFKNARVPAPRKKGTTAALFTQVLDNVEAATADKPFRLMTSPARQFLNTSFTETPGSRAREGRPTVLVHPADADRLGLADGDRVALGNERGTARVHARRFDGLQPGVLVWQPAPGHTQPQYPLPKKRELMNIRRNSMKLPLIVPCELASIMSTGER